MQVSVSTELSSILDDAAALGARRGQPYVGVEHLFEITAGQTSLLPRSFVERHFRTLNIVIRELQREAWGGVLPPTGQDVFYTPRCANVLHEAARFARVFKQSEPRATHLMLALLADNLGAPARVLDRLELDRGALLRELRGAIQAEQGTKRESDGVPDQKPEAEDTPDPLSRLTRDLTAAAKAGRLEPVIGRGDEIRQIMEALSRKSKNNVMLVGEAGVGKTRVVEGMALAGVNGDGGEMLGRYRFLELNLSALMAGTQYRGAFEEKVQELIDTLKHARNTVLFVDEAHLIMGAGAVNEGGGDLANLLKPALARGEIRCIGATTLDEYRKFIERDPALERRFQMVRVEALSPSATWEVLNRIRPSFEKHHGVSVSRRALHAAITLTQRYMPNRCLPDKAIDVVDQACAHYRLYSVAARNRPEMFEGGSDRKDPGKVTPHDIRKVVSQLTAIPLEEITAEERRRLEDLDGRFKERIIGQDEAVNRVVSAVKKVRAGLSDPNRPDAVMLFLGPTGVGKTQLAKVLADLVFGSENHLITFDMGEYGEPHMVARLIGAPPGYAGHDEEGRLTGAVRAKPFSVLLFDEIEKAHPKVFDALLTLLDEGRLKDSLGRTVSFRNCMILFTSNIGADLFGRGERSGTDPSVLIEALHQHFRPEFINRIDEIIPFYPLLFEDIRSILVGLVNELTSRLRGRRIGLHVYQGALEHLAEKGYSQAFGARELRRTVERLVVNPISALMVEGRFEAGDTIEVLMEGEELHIRARKTDKASTA